MIAREPRTLGYYAASHWFQWAVLLIVIGVVAIGLIQALERARNQAEREAIELTVRNMRTGLQLAMGEALMHQREAEIASWVGSNPVRWLSREPAGYRGDCTHGDGSELNGGEWCFDLTQKRLLYRPYRVGDLNGSMDGAVCDRLSWRVVRSPAQGSASGGFVGLRVETDSQCGWGLMER